MQNGFILDKSSMSFSFLKYVIHCFDIAVVKQIPMREVVFRNEKHCLQDFVAYLTVAKNSAGFACL